MNLPFFTNVRTMEDVRKALIQFNHSGWQAYTAALQASVTSPSVGAGSVAGYYWSGMGLCIASVIATFGSGLSAGSGQYKITLPMASQSGVALLGVARYRDDSASNVATGISVISSVGASTADLYYSTTPGASDGITDDGAPFTWAAGDTIIATVLYPTA